MNPRLIDLLIRAGAIHAMTADNSPLRSIAVRGDSIVAVSHRPDGLDGLLAPGTHVIDDPGLFLLPAFNDTHNHLMEATRNRSLVPVEQARTMSEFVSLIRRKAAGTEKGRSIQTSKARNERGLAENRLPTVRDLDQATVDHPVLVRRGGHMAVLNSAALGASGITAATADPHGGKIGRFADGTLNGVLEGGAQYALVHVPPARLEEQLAGVEESSGAFAAAGIGSLRDPVVAPEGIRLYQAALEQGRLRLRVRPLLLVSPGAPSRERIREIEGLALRSGFGNDWLRVWGLKFVLDGGPEGGALEAPYANDPDSRKERSSSSTPSWRTRSSGLARYGSGSGCRPARAALRSGGEPPEAVGTRAHARGHAGQGVAGGRRGAVRRDGLPHQLLRTHRVEARHRRRSKAQR